MCHPPNWLRWWVNKLIFTCIYNDPFHSFVHTMIIAYPTPYHCIAGNFRWYTIRELPPRPSEENFVVLNFALAYRQDHTHHQLISAIACTSQHTRCNIEIFMILIFVAANLIHENHEILHHAKIFCYIYTDTIYSVFVVLFHYIRETMRKLKIHLHLMWFDLICNIPLLHTVPSHELYEVCM